MKQKATEHRPHFARTCDNRCITLWIINNVLYNFWVCVAKLYIERVVRPIKSCVISRVHFTLRGYFCQTDSQVDASFWPFGHPAQVDTSWSQVICCYKNALTNDMREMYGFWRLAADLRIRLATLRKSVRKFWLRVRLARALGCVDFKPTFFLFFFLQGDLQKPPQVCVRACVHANVSE